MPDLAYLALAAALFASAAAMLLAAVRLQRRRDDTPGRAPAQEPEPTGRPSLAALAALVEARSVPRPRVGAAPAAMKACPDCAEEVLAAARVCKHCRYRFDEPGELRLSV